MPGTSRIYNSPILFLQGFVLVVFSIIIFTSLKEPSNIRFYVAGLVAVCFAILLLTRYFFGEDRGRVFPDLVTAVALMSLGFVIFKTDALAREWVLFALSGMLVLLAANVLQTSWEMKYVFRQWWLSIITFFLSLLTVFSIWSQNDIPRISFSLLMALQVLSLGLLMIWLSILDKRLSVEYRMMIKDLKV